MPGLQSVLGEKTGKKVFIHIHGPDAPRKSQEPDPMGRKSKYTEEVGHSIAQAYAEGEGTIVEIMQKHGLSERIFYIWKEENLQFFQLIKNAEQMRQGHKKEMALNGLKKLLEGYEYTEQTTEAVPMAKKGSGQQDKKITKTILHRKHQSPNATAIIFTLCNTAPDEFKSVQHIKYDKPTEMPPFDFSEFTEEELELWEKLAEKAQPKNGQV